MWTIETRVRYDRSEVRYPSNLTKEQWTLIEPLIPAEKRKVVNGLIYVLLAVCQWRAVAKDLPPQEHIVRLFRPMDRTSRLIAFNEMP
jgi:transposase